MRWLCSFYANDVLWVLIFEEEQFSFNQATQPPRKIKKNGNFTLFSQGAFFAQYLKDVSTVEIYLFPAVIRFVFRVFLSSFWRTKGLPNGHFCHFLQCCHVLIVFCFVCLFVVVVLHRICSQKFSMKFQFWADGSCFLKFNCCSAIDFCLFWIESFHWSFNSETRFLWQISSNHWKLPKMRSRTYLQCWKHSMEKMYSSNIKHCYIEVLLTFPFLQCKQHFFKTEKENKGYLTLQN